MGYLNQRQAVLAENVANADTPGYKARDLAPLTFDDALKQASVGMAITDPKHILPAVDGGRECQNGESGDCEVLPSGNSVDLSQQMMEVSKTAVDYQGLVPIYHALGSMVKMAIKGTRLAGNPWPITVEVSDIYSISGSALKAQEQRIKVIAENIANARHHTFCAGAETLSTACHHVQKRIRQGAWRI